MYGKINKIHNDDDKYILVLLIRREAQVGLHPWYIGGITSIVRFMSGVKYRDV